MLTLLTALTFWHWFVFGMMLMVLEVMIFGAFFLWLGIAALMIGVAMMFVPMLWTISIPLWATLSIVLILGFQLYRKKNPKTEVNSGLNQRGHEYIGQVFTLEKPVLHGKGEIRTADTVWKIVCNQDVSAGSSVRVTGLDGTSLRVEVLS